MKIDYLYRPPRVALQLGVLLVLVLACATDRATPQRFSGEPATREAPKNDDVDYLTSAVEDAKGLDNALARLHAPTLDSQPMLPHETLTKLSPQRDLAVDLIAAEPDVRQPLNITFDERGRMWVVQYIQYPFPAGLKVVEYDQYIRAKFDKVPPAPPDHFQGSDKITIHEDTDGDGTFDAVKTFVDGLSIATSVLPGTGGVWVLNPPYLLFYPDADGDDVPDAKPEVHLSGFGLEDTHAVANSLMWGPDGWLYGCQGSTCTARIKVEITGEDRTTNFLGQAIWRYHPSEHRFELFAEGGGNMFGLEFDDKGRAFSGTNWGFRGLHYVQGGYYQKNWGKHGALTNPYAFGFFNHMPYTGSGDRLTHTFVVYSGGLLPPRFDGRIIGPNPLQGRIHVSRLVASGSTFGTVDDDHMVVSGDGWFRPVDLKVGPDGALYVADFYERRISHVDPRDTWDRSNGRIYRIRPIEWTPGYKPFDLRKLPVAQLLDVLGHKNRWRRCSARRILIERQDASIVPLLRDRLGAGLGQSALEALWTLQGLGSLDDETALAALDHGDPFVRLWTVRLLADFPNRMDDALARKLLARSEREQHPEVRSQLASSARRLSAKHALPIVLSMLRNDPDASDPFIPMLLWWALEKQIESCEDEVMLSLTQPEAWQRTLIRSTIMQRLSRRLASDLSPSNQGALAKLFAAAPGPAERESLITGVNEAFAGREIKGVSQELTRVLVESGNIEIGIRMGEPKAHAKVIEYIDRDDEETAAKRIEYIRLLGQVGLPSAVPALLKTATGSSSSAVRCAALAALTRFDDPQIGVKLVQMYVKLPLTGDVRPAAINTLLSRPSWTQALLEGIRSETISKGVVGADQLRRIREHEDKAIAALADDIFGPAERATSKSKEREILRITEVVSRGTGTADQGRAIFAVRCASCHTLFGEGGRLGPDLTGYERRNTKFLVHSIVDPSAVVREEFTSFRVRTSRGQTFVGMIAERSPRHLTIVDAGQTTAIPLEEVKEEQALTTSTMPEDLLTGLTNHELRDLFKYLQFETPIEDKGSRPTPRSPDDRPNAR